MFNSLFPMNSIPQSPTERNAPQGEAVAPQIETFSGGFSVPRVAVVAAEPHRKHEAARKIAAALAKDPEGYLAVCRICRVPGVLDMRRVFGR